MLRPQRTPPPFGSLLLISASSLTSLDLTAEQPSLLQKLSPSPTFREVFKSLHDNFLADKTVLLPLNSSPVDLEHPFLLACEPSRMLTFPSERG